MCEHIFFKRNGKQVLSYIIIKLMVCCITFGSVYSNLANSVFVVFVRLTILRC